MALADTLLAAHFNRPGHTVIDHRTCVLHQLVAFCDDNGISIDGDVKTFRSFPWR